jgi:hypothetical protein
MPRLFPSCPEGLGASLESEQPFEAGILGWGSYSHLRTEQQRIRTLSSFARYVRGPILISFLHFTTNPVVPNGTRTRGFLTKLEGRLNQRSGDRFSAYIGFTHDVSATEFAVVADRSGLRVVHLDADSRDTNWPHAVLYPRHADGYGQA